MNDHIDEQISQYLDGTLSAGPRAEVQRHLAGCAECTATLNDLVEVKRRLSTLPRLKAPADLVAALVADHGAGEGAPVRRLRAFWPVPAAFAAVAVMIGGWGYLNTGATAEAGLDGTSLILAHSRYEAEGLVPHGDLVASDYSGGLAEDYAEPEAS